MTIPEASDSLRLGAHADAAGVHFAVYSAHAERIELCLFSDEDGREVERLDFSHRTGDIWHMHVPGLRPARRYGFRAHGPYDPDQGHRFNPNKLLLDPYARALSGWFGDPDLLCGYRMETGDDLTFDGRDNASVMPRCIVTENRFDWQGDRHPSTPWEQTVIYEAHPRGLTMLMDKVPEAERGLFSGLASDPVIAHLTDLGITAIELLPVHAFLDDAFLTAKGRVNYWGYNTAAFFAPDPRYLGSGGADDFRRMVRRFHAAGIEVLLDVVYNHTAEGNELGPTLSFRGLDNASYYALHPDHPRFYVNDTGCGNTLACWKPAVIRLILDSLRYWVEEMHVDGFRFDLAAVLGRTPTGFEPNGALFTALLADPVLTKAKLIAEPWDIGPGGYRLGGFPAPFAEWNDRFRDGVRRFWRNDPGYAPDLATRLLGSADTFDHSGRQTWSSVNFVTAHDGFTLADLVTYARKHNQANGEENRDGHDHNFSSNAGHEGWTDDPAIRDRRDRRRRNLMATLLLSQGVPMLLAGDELANSQKGNNNTYCQDNPTGWIDWSGTGEAFHRFVRHVVALRKQYPVLRQTRFLHGATRPEDGLPDVAWFGPDGAPPEWENEDLGSFGLLLRGTAGAVEKDVRHEEALVIVNRGAETRFQMPHGPRWRCVLDTREDDGLPRHGKDTDDQASIAAESIALFVRNAPPA
ncbi:MAG: glycogen debranching protein GlgX [Pseudomonadota bacterium]